MRVVQTRLVPCFVGTGHLLCCHLVTRAFMRKTKLSASRDGLAIQPSCDDRVENSRHALLRLL